MKCPHCGKVHTPISQVIGAEALHAVLKRTNTQPVIVKTQCCGNLCDISLVFSLTKLNKTRCAERWNPGTNEAAPHLHKG